MDESEMKPGRQTCRFRQVAKMWPAISVAVDLSADLHGSHFDSFLRSTVIVTPHACARTACDRNINSSEPEAFTE